MPNFDFTFTVRASLERVAEFHHDTRALKLLTPPPVIVQLHRIEPLAEGSVSEFTLWFGPLPVRWVAVHTNVSQNGFTDTLRDGLLKRWQHTHTFTAEGEELTRISEHVEYEHDSGPRGILSRLLFPKPSLYALFNYRKWATRSVLER